MTVVLISKLLDLREIRALLKKDDRHKGFNFFTLFIK